MIEFLVRILKKIGCSKVYLEELLAVSHGVFQHSSISIKVQQGTPS